MKIESVEKDSIASQLELEKGDDILKINGKLIGDVLDFLHEEQKKRLKLLVLKQDGNRELLVVKKDALEGLGVEFSEDFCTRCCKNKCIFCFIDQMPKGLRSSLYLKDDDYRLSFSEGNYVTLTNVSKTDLRRIKKYKLSPLYVSVHAITPRIRCSMLNNHDHKNVLNIIKSLAKCIEIHVQIVLVPGFNDGEELKKTLLALIPYVKTIAVVPVGLTKFRQGLPKLRAVDGAVANATIDCIQNVQNLCNARYGECKVYAADELYILAQRPLPSYEVYGNFDQIENGIGMISKLEHEFFEAIKGVSAPPKIRCVSIATGKSAYNTIKRLVEQLQNVCKNVKVNVYQINNNFFGTSITTAGLLVGKDIIEQLKGKELGSQLLLCNTMLRFGTQTFLDDTSVLDVESALNVKVKTVENTGHALVNAILGE